VSSASIQHDVVAFVRALRDGGIPVGIEHTESLARALAFVDVASRRDLYLAARAMLVFRHEDLPLFDGIFAAFWGGGATTTQGARVPPAPRFDPSGAGRTALVSLMAQRAKPGDREVEVPQEMKAASALEILQRKDFGDLTPEELDSMRCALRELRLQPLHRVTRRYVPARRGRSIDLGRAMRAASRHGGVVLTLPRRRHKVKRRPLVVIADISGSMELYSRLLLQFLHGLARAHGRTETFVFGTRLTRITAELALRNVDAALQHASAKIVDFAGGTRISESLHTFNRLHARRVLRSGAVLLLISDGWETGDLSLLDAEMEKLKSGCHRLIWLNPLLGRETYRPQAGGMSIALRHVDDFLPVNDLQSLKELAAHLGSIPARRGSPPRKVSHR
jgi:hypothetical protein